MNKLYLRDLFDGKLSLKGYIASQYYYNYCNSGREFIQLKKNPLSRFFIFIDVSQLNII